MVIEDISKNKEGCFLLNGIYGFKERFVNDVLKELLSIQDRIDFWDFVKIDGMLHGTGVWIGNAKSFLQRGYSFDEVIATREDCFDYFCQHGIDDKTAYQISEDVCRGKARCDGWLDKWGQILRNHDIPEWYIDSCRKILYLFPRGHCIAFAQRYWQILYYKAHYPEDFYQCYLEMFADSEDKEIIAGGKSVIKAVLKKFSDSGIENNDVPEGDHNINILKTALEMYERKDLSVQE